jgi:glycosyltransferase involved in cell wall biosynthesis
MAPMALIRVHCVIDALDCGGAQMMLVELAKVAPLVDLRLSVSYLADRGGSPAALRLRELGVDAEHVRVRPRAVVHNVRALRGRIKAVRPHVLHTHLGSADLYGGLVSRSLRLPGVSTLHAVEQAGDPRGRQEGLGPGAARIRRVCADRVIAVSEAVRAAYLARGYDRPERVVTVRNAVSLRPEPGSGESLRRELDVPPGAFVVLLLAAVREGKGHDIAIDAMHRLRTERPGAVLLIAGDGPLEQEVRRRAGHLGHAVRVLGYREDVPRLLDASDALVVPSVMEAFPTSVLEAMAAGLPVVASDVGGIPEMVDDGVTGILVRPDASELAAALERLMDDSQGRTLMGSVGRTRFEHEFGPEPWGKRLREVYEVVAGPRSLRTHALV